MENQVVGWFTEAFRMLSQLRSSRLILKFGELLHSLATIERLLYSTTMFLTSEQQTTFRKAVVEFGRHYQWLRFFYESNGEQFFLVTPKVHGMQHLPMQMDLINCRFVQCYLEESSIGRLCRI